MRRTAIIFGRELASYFRAPIAWVSLIVFLVLAGALTFFVGDFFERGQADLQPFFAFHPWLYLVLVPVLSMRLWAAERKTGSIQLILTLPIRLGEAVLGKFLAAWCFAGIALALTFPFWLTVNFLGDPDNGVIAAGYAASWLMAGAALAIGAALSAATRNQVVAFVATLTLLFVLIAAGTSTVHGLLQGRVSPRLVDAIAEAGLLRHFVPLTRGVVTLRDLVYFLSLMIAFLGANAILVDLKKAD